MSKDSQKKSKRKGRNKQEVMAVSQAEPEPEVVKTPIDLMKAQESGSSSSQKKKKNTFVSLYNKEGQDKLAILLPGRHSCECLAQKHNLINNCMSCGRIVCEQEGSGPCIFCGSLVRKQPVLDHLTSNFMIVLCFPSKLLEWMLLIQIQFGLLEKYFPLVSHVLIWINQVCTKEEQEILQRDSNKSQKLRKKLMGETSHQ